LFQDKLQSNKIDENSDAIAILEINPISKAHSLVIPKKHSEKVSKKLFEVADTPEKLIKIPIKKLEKIILKAYKKNFKQNKQLFKKAFELKKQGYKIAVLSDQWYLSKEALMPDKLYKKFDEVVVSCDVGVRKPNPKIYKLILKKLNFQQNNFIYWQSRMEQQPS